MFVTNAMGVRRPGVADGECGDRSGQFQITTADLKCSRVARGSRLRTFLRNRERNDSVGPLSPAPPTLPTQSNTSVMPPSENEFTLSSSVKEDDTFSDTAASGDAFVQGIDGHPRFHTLGKWNARQSASKTRP